MQVHCPGCQGVNEFVDETPSSSIDCTSCGRRFVLSEVETILHAGRQAGETADHRRDPSFTTSEATETTSVFGDFEIVEELARGGMGIVYKARQRSLGRTVALKMIKAGELADETEVRRFFSEAEAAAKLDHPHIVPIYEVGTHDGRHYFAMGYVDGETLAERTRDGPLASTDVAELVKTIAIAVAYAHEQGIIHRDLKPSNIMLDKNGQPRVTDFGLAKQIQSDSNLTASGQVLGTPSYMPPEQAAGLTDQIGERADVYSLGAILYCLLAGRPPFQAANVVETLKQVIEDDPVAPQFLNAEADHDLETICLKCLRKQPEKRYASAADLAADLQRWLENKPIAARRVGSLEKAWLWCKRRPAVAGLLAALLFVFSAGTLVVIERQHATHAAGLVQSLVKADITQVPRIVDEIGEYRRWTGELLREAEHDAADDPNRLLRVSLALVPIDDSQVDHLYGRLLNCSLEEFIVIRAALISHRERLTGRLLSDWETLDHDQRLRAACALAQFDPDNQAWKVFAAGFAGDLVSERARSTGPWLKFLRPIAHSLRTPLLAIVRQVGDEARSAERARAIEILARQNPDHVGILVDVLTFSGRGGFQLVFSRLKAHRNEAVPRLQQRLRTDTMGFRSRVNVAVALLGMGSTAEVVDRMRHSPDPSFRSGLIHGFERLGADALPLVPFLEVEQDVSVRRAVILSLGEFDPNVFPTATRTAIVQKLQHFFGNDPDAGIHGAAEWTLHQWRQGKILQPTQEYSPACNWYVTGQGQTMAVIRGPVEFTMGLRRMDSDGRSVDSRRRERIERDFAIASKEVTIEQFQKFLQDQPGDSQFPNKGGDKTSAHPITSVTWYEAVRYCRWLSEQEGIPEHQMCYPPISHIKEGMKLPPDFSDRIGYRLPEEAEWEFACRAGAQTVYYFGGTQKLMGNDPGMSEMLGKYAWYLSNSHGRTWPVGRLEPNDFGLFDMHGNAAEFCQDASAGDGAISVSNRPDEESPTSTANNLSGRVLKGGAFNNQSTELESSRSRWTGPRERNYNIGFRVARTCP